MDDIKGYPLKRVIDIIGASLGIVVAMPILLSIVVVIWLKMGRPFLFRQVRPGLHGEPFVMFKFRTMTNDCGVNGNLLPDAERLTPFGQFLRHTSLDELPELINVLRGEMSLVGPRPLL